MPKPTTLNLGSLFILQSNEERASSSADSGLIMLVSMFVKWLKSERMRRRHFSGKKRAKVLKMDIDIEETKVYIYNDVSIWSFVD